MLFNTFTKEKLDKKVIDHQYIQNIIDYSFELSLNDFKGAVNILLNKEPSVFSQVINQISESKFKRKSGEMGDFSKPICPDFVIQRKIVSTIQQHFSNGASLVGVIGPAFSGKTNLLYQFFKVTHSEKAFALYLDGGDHNYSIFQQLANHFSKNAKIVISSNKIRDWLINSLNGDSKSKFYLLIDNFNNDIPEVLKSEIVELIDIFKGVNHHTLYTIDEFNYKRLAFVENRQYKTVIGDQSIIEQLDELDDKEYELAKELLFDEYRIAIEHGGHYTPEYREPRVLRHLALIYKNNIQEDHFVKILAVPDLDHLNVMSQNKTYSRQVHEMYRKITHCFLAETSSRRNYPDLEIVASGRGAVTTTSFKKYFSDDFDALLKSSYMVIRELRNDLTVIYPKIPELIAKYSISHLVSLILTEKRRGKSYKELCQVLIDAVAPIPYCDIVEYSDESIPAFRSKVYQHSGAKGTSQFAGIP